MLSLSLSDLPKPKWRPMLALIESQMRIGKNGCGKGCAGVEVATEEVADQLRKGGFSLTIGHRDLEAAPRDATEGMPQTGRGKNSRVRA